MIFQFLLNLVTPASIKNLFCSVIISIAIIIGYFMYTGAVVEAIIVPLFLILTTAFTFFISGIKSYLKERKTKK